MPLQQVTIEIEDETDAAYVSDALFELGALSVSTTDLHRNTPNEQPLYGEPPQNTILGQTKPVFWKQALITALFPLTMPAEQLLMTIGTSFNLHQTPNLRIDAAPFDDKTPAEWVAHAQASFKPIHLGTAAITFPWHKPIEGVLNVVLEPGLAFGTGEHATTQLCARWILGVVRPGMRVLDYGTGSGVLAILSCLLGEGIEAVGVDLDPDAIKVARTNAELNGVQQQAVFCENKDEPLGGNYDVVIANILKGPLKELADHLIGKVRPGGKIALAGLLVEQAEEMKLWYQERGVVMDEANVEAGWILLVGKKQHRT